MAHEKEPSATNTRLSTLGCAALGGDSIHSETPAAAQRERLCILRQAAVGYAAMGWPLVQLIALGKTPLRKGWRDNPIRDSDAAHRDWARNPWANIGLHTGAPSRIVVIDVDPRNGGSVAALVAKFGLLPATVESETPSGGGHLYFSCDFTIPNSVGRIASGIDVRGDGGFVVLPPSAVRRDDGTWCRYRWRQGHEPWEIPIIKLPDAIARTALPPPRPLPQPPVRSFAAGRSGALAGLVRTVALATVGQRNASLYWAARCVREAGGDHFAVCVLEQAAAQCGLPPDEVQRTIASAFQTGKRRS